MSKRFTEEFKIEAVKQVTERNHPVAEVAARRGLVLADTACTNGSNATACHLSNEPSLLSSKRRCVNLKPN
jgi:hypothetical protein